MERFTVKKLAKITGVSVRTLHHYDALGLLSPLVRTEAGYRVYGSKELLRLQQILFYKELDFPLNDIKELLDSPNFDYLMALQNHREALFKRKQRIAALLQTIDKTILKIKGEYPMLTNEELYAGFGKDKAHTIRQEAIEKYGNDTIEQSENNLRKMGKEQFEILKEEGEQIAQAITLLMHLPYTHDDVQEQVHKHYHHIVKMWGGAIKKHNIPQAYKGLAQMYVDDKRFYANLPSDFKEFLSNAMVYYAQTRLD